MEELEKEQKIKALFGIIALLISVFSIGFSIKFSAISYALYGLGIGAFVLGYGLSPSFLLSSVTSSKSKFSKTSSNIVLLGCFFMLLGAFIQYVSKT